ncbi:nuclear transport factor 2 family protein [Nitrolancea hollandica]|uniref:SnoaL-like domain-containing protein n=1 Tax=Nitrolancea hollandica Lb TaxID=1129897 RepID=I4EEI9_9BACT|nr:nuclear transport factor 2 family protein [Nitrolancea hollandica]CCF83101.1 conserved hypothetical protein [Nitrolancea hollandica Lb]
MSAEENRDLVRIPYEAFNDRDFDRVLPVIAPDARITSPVIGGTFAGPAGFQQYLQTWADAFPDARIEITKIIADQEGAAVEFTGRGTNAGPLVTPAGEISPTGRHGEQRFCDVYRIRNGKIVGLHVYFDLTTLLTYVDVAGLLREFRLST